MDRPAFSRYAVLSFDCYGTLIDWEQGLLGALRPWRERHHLRQTDDEVLQLFALEEAAVEAGPYRPYRDVLAIVMRGMADRLHVAMAPGEETLLADSLPSWEPFPDTVPALRRLRDRFRLGVLSNVDLHQFDETARGLQIVFDYLVTAQHVRAYKPAAAHFEQLLTSAGVPADRVLHVAQSRYHDIEPARRLGFGTVWVNRRKGKEGGGATRESTAQADVEVPDLEALVTLLDER